MKTMVITGANRGIGLELSRQYAADGHDVIAVCRSSSKELDALNVEIIDDVDVATDHGVERLKEKIDDRTIDILINNAGVFLNDTFPELSADGLRTHFEVNTLGPIRVTLALLDQLAGDARVILITSRIGSMGDNDSGHYYGYRISKAALNMAGVNLSIDLKPRGIAVGILHPGYVQTDMTSQQGNITPAESAELLIERIEELNLNSTGTFRHANGDPLPW